MIKMLLKVVEVNADVRVAILTGNGAALVGVKEKQEKQET